MRSAQDRRRRVGRCGPVGPLAPKMGLNRGQHAFGHDQGVAAIGSVGAWLAAFADTVQKILVLIGQGIARRNLQFSRPQIRFVQVVAQSPRARAATWPPRRFRAGAPPNWG